MLVQNKQQQTLRAFRLVIGSKCEKHCCFSHLLTQFAEQYSQQHSKLHSVTLVRQKTECLTPQRLKCIQ